MKAPKTFFYADYDFNIKEGDMAEVEPRKTLEGAEKDADRYLFEKPKETIVIYECHALQTVKLRKRTTILAPLKVGP